MFGNLVTERKSFRWDDEAFIDAKVSNECKIIGELISIISASESINNANRAQRLAEEGGAMSAAASNANAADRINIGQLNAGAVTGAAANTARGIREVGAGNADAVLEAAFHNLRMYDMQSKEELRIHKMQEKWHAGEIRARLSGTGIQVNTGSSMAYLRSEIKKGIDERRFMQTRDAYSMLGDAEDALRTSLLTVKTANINAAITQENAALQAGVMMAEAMADAAAMVRQGEIYAAVGVANGSAARASGYASALGSLSAAAPGLSNAYTNWRNSQSANSYGMSYVGPNMSSGYTDSNGYGVG
jgi:hypothetical protein